MKKIVLLLVVAPVAVLAVSSTPAGFTDNLDAAFAAAKENGKYVYVCFSGSDWCGWCKALEAEVFSDGKFRDGVTNDYELVFVDSPSNTDVLSDRAKTENPKLVKKYDINGFPTALVFSSDGQKIAETGYRKGGAAKYVAHLMAIRTNADAYLKKESAREAYAGKLEARQDKIIATLYAELAEVQKKPYAKAAASLETLIREIESEPVPDGMSDVKKEVLDDMRETVRSLKGDTAVNKADEDDVKGLV